MCIDLWLFYLEKKVWSLITTDREKWQSTIQDFYQFMKIIIRSLVIIYLNIYNAYIFSWCFFSYITCKELLFATIATIIACMLFWTKPIWKQRINIKWWRNEDNNKNSNCNTSSKPWSNQIVLLIWPICEGW